MNRKARILFCNPTDTWTFPIKKMMANIQSELNVEIIVTYEEYEQKDDRFISLSPFLSSVAFQKIAKIESENLKLPHDLIENRIKFIEKTHGKKVDRKKIENDLILRLGRVRMFFQIIEPDVVIVWNGNLSGSELFRREAERRRISLLYAEKGVLPESWYIDPQGINANSTIAKMSEEFMEVEKKEIYKFKRFIGVIDQNGTSAWPQPERIEKDQMKESLGINEKQKVILFPCQVENDTNIILFSNHFKTNSSVIKWLTDSIGSDYFLLVKSHPMGLHSDKIELKRILGKHGKIVENANILDLIEISDIVVTINSTVGFEASIRNCPVLQLGKGILDNKSFVSEFHPGSNALSQIELCIKTYSENSVSNHNNSLRFGTYLFSRYYTFRNDPDRTVKRIKSLIPRLQSKQTAFSINEIKCIFTKISGEDLRKYVSGKTLFRAIVAKTVIRIKNLFNVIRTNSEKSDNKDH